MQDGGNLVCKQCRQERALVQQGIPGRVGGYDRYISWETIDGPFFLRSSAAPVHRTRAPTETNPFARCLHRYGLPDAYASRVSVDVDLFDFIDGVQRCDPCRELA